MTEAYINYISVAVPNHQIHNEFIAFARNSFDDRRNQSVFERMVKRSGIDSRYSVLTVTPDPNPNSVSAYDFYHKTAFPKTRERMQVFERSAPELLRSTLDRLRISEVDRERVRHLIVTCCTGHYAPGLDFEIIEHLKLNPETSRTMIGFMGCYAAINGLRLAQSIVRAHPDESVLLVSLELCSLHLQQTQDLSEMLSYLIFADGCAAAIVSSQQSGFAIDSFRSIPLNGTRSHITWRIGDEGFLMHLSGDVPSDIEKLLRLQADTFPRKEDIALWAVHPGGRTVLDAVEQGLMLSDHALTASRDVLRSYGNMSSATVMFVLEKLMQSAKTGEQGFAISFGPGIVAETMKFHAI